MLHACTLAAAPTTSKAMDEPPSTRHGHLASCQQLPEDSMPPPTATSIPRAPHLAVPYGMWWMWCPGAQQHLMGRKRPGVLHQPAALRTQPKVMIHRPGSTNRRPHRKGNTHIKYVRTARTLYAESCAQPATHSEQGQAKPGSGLQPSQCCGLEQWLSSLCAVNSCTRCLTDSPE